MRERKRYPKEGIYAVVGGLSDQHYLKPAHARRYRYVMPAYDDLPAECWLADCWIVDAHGNVNPGTNCSPVPVALDSIGRRIRKEA